MAPANQLAATLAALEAAASPQVLAEMSPRYGIVAAKALGVPMAQMQSIARGLGRDHDLAAVLWATGWYEARTLACLIEDPDRVTPAQMDGWAACATGKEALRAVAIADAKRA